MKRKLLSFIIAFAFILTGAVALTACGDAGDVKGKTFVFADVQLTKTDGTALTEEEKANEYLAGFFTMMEGWKEESKGTTAKCEENGEVTGSCDLVGLSFDKLKAKGTPAHWTYDAKRENPVEITLNDGEDDYTLAGKLVDNTLTLKMSLAAMSAGAPENVVQAIAGYVVVFTMTVA